MTSFSIVYVVQRFFYRIFVFLRNWYIGSFFAVSHRTLLILGSLDQSFALRVNLRHFFDPLYQDHTALGHTLGVFFRGSRLAGAVVLYAAIVAAALFLYLSWAAIPIIILWKGFF